MVHHVALDDIRSGQYSAPAAQTVAKVCGGPWPKGKCLFRRNKDESAADWRKKVLASAEVRRHHPAHLIPASAAERLLHKRRQLQRRSRL